MTIKGKFFWLLPLLLLAACASRPVNLLESGVVKVEAVSSGTVEVTHVSVHQHPDGAVDVDVMVKPRERVRWFLSGNLLIQVIEPDGGTFEIEMRQPEHKDHALPAHSEQHAHFVSRLPFSLKEGTLIRVVHVAD